MDARELKDKASQLFTKGKFGKAAETYEEYCAADKKDHLARLRCGDAWSKAGKKDKAVQAYSMAAEGFARDGFLPRAIAASKLVLELDPNHKAVQKMLADLYAQKRGPAPAAKSSAASGLRPTPGPEITRAVEGPGTAAGFAKRREAIDLEAPAPAKAAPARAEAPPVNPGSRPDAIELPSYEIPLETEAAPVAATGHKPTAHVAAIELDLESGSASAGGGARAEPAALVETGIEIELSSGQPVTGEVEIPIEGQALPDADQLPAELQAPAPALARPIDPLAAPAPSAPIFELTVEADAPAPAAPPRPTEPTTSGVYELTEELPTKAAAPAGSGVYELRDEVPVAARPTASVVYDLSDEVEEAPASASAPEQAAAPAPVTPAAVEAPPPAGPAARPAEPPAVARAPVEVPSAEAPEATPLPPSVAAAPPPPGIAPVKPGEAALPPGLRPRRAPEPSAAPATPASRIWLPPTFTPPAHDVALTAAAAAAAAAATTPEPTPATDLERGLQAFMQFDPDAAPVSPRPASAAAAPPPARSFTELDLDEGDSLLHAVEAAAAAATTATPAAPGAEHAEEAMEAPEEPKLEPGALPKIPLFSDLPEDAFIALFERCPLQRFDAGQLVFEQGDKADAFYVICGGKTRVFRVENGARKDLATIEEGSFFGELALLSDAPRSASVEAVEDDTQVLVISAEVLRELSAAHPAVASALKKFSRQRMLTNLMNNAPLFAPFSRGDRRDLVQKFRARDVPRGEVLVREGQASDGLYVVLYGEVEVVAKGRALATLREGQVFGEMSLLQRTPATATVRATRHTSLLRLPKPDFDTLILSHPQVLEHVAELVDERTKANASAGML